MKKSSILIFLLLLFCSSQYLSAQGYIFTDLKKNAATPVKNQASSGTCWSYGAAAFLESELLRTGKGEYDLSEMYIVRYNYLKRMD